MTTENRILILDFGSQFTQLIARRIRELHVYCEVHPPTVSMDFVRAWNPRAVILAGGPSSVYDEGAPKVDAGVLDLDAPVLGICYGMQLIAQLHGAPVIPGKREYGRAELRVLKNDAADVNARADGGNGPAAGNGSGAGDDADLFYGFDSGESITVWASHGDHVDEPPAGFRVLAATGDIPVAAFRSETRPHYGVQFHPEVAHTPRGEELLANFVFRIAGCEPTWTAGSFIEEQLAKIREQVGDRKVICGLSGGVDSSVAAALVHRAIGDQLTCVFVDTGLLRKNEREGVERAFRRHMGDHLVTVDAGERFLTQLSGVEEPELKRKRIGETFIRVFEQSVRDAGSDAAFLVQGTLYPDVIESQSVHGPSAVIKTHHNVGGLPADMKFKLIEPLRELFKDEVRQVGRELGLPEELVGRHPFPGPGLAIRVLGEVTEDRLAVLREADAIYLEEIRAAGLYDDIWQAFAVLLPVRSVGVMGDYRTYENVCALRAVTSRDGMTADWYPFPHEALGRISSRIINEVKGVNRVCYDISSKPPATIEWE